MQKLLEEFYCPHCGFLTIKKSTIKCISIAGGICPVCHKDPKTAIYFESHKYALGAEHPLPTKE